MSSISKSYRTWLDFHQDESGIEGLEYILIVTFVILPLLAVPFMAAQIMTQYYYRVITDVISLPFP